MLHDDPKTYCAKIYRRVGLSQETETDSRRPEVPGICVLELRGLCVFIKLIEHNSLVIPYSTDSLCHSAPMISKSW